MSAQLAQALEKIHALAGGEPFEYRQIALEALAAFEAAPQQEPDCWAILTPNGSKLVSPDEAKGRKDAYPLYAAPQQAQAPTQAEVDLNEALLEVDYWKRIAAHLAAPVGYKLVPVRPTPEMLEAAKACSLPSPLKAAWARMLAAAPQQGSKT